MEPLLAVTSEDELVALDRALMAAKFWIKDDLVPGSPRIASILGRIASRSISKDPQLRAWYTLDRSSLHWKAATLQAVPSRRWWQTASAESRIALARNLVAPFHVSAEDLDLFVRRVEQILANEWYSIWRACDSPGVRLVTMQPTVTVDRKCAFAVIDADGATELFSSTDEFVVLEWLRTRDYSFVTDGVR